MYAEIEVNAFRDTFEALAQKVAAALINAPRPRIPGWNISFAEDSGQITLSDGLVDEPAFLIGNHGDLIQSLAEYSELRSATLGSTFLRSHLASDKSTGDDVRDDVLWQRINGLLNRSLLPTFIYNQDRARETVERFVAEAERASTAYLVRAYFRVSGPRVTEDLPFTDNGVIHPLTNDEIAALVRSLRFFTDSGLTASAASMFKTVLMLRFESSSSNILRITLPRPLEDYQTALRLVVGRVAFAFATIEIESVFGSRYWRAILPYRKGLWMGGDELALLPELDIGPRHLIEANSLFDRLSDSPNRQVIATAVRRFNDALERTRLDDSLIDCVVGMESILTRDDKSEVLRRLRQRLAVMIGLSKDDRVNVYRAIPKIYDARSSIAHGDQPKTSLYELLPVVEDYLSRLLRRLLMDSTKFDAPAVDVTIVRGDGDFALDSIAP